MVPRNTFNIHPWYDTASLTMKGVDARPIARPTRLLELVVVAAVGLYLYNRTDRSSLSCQPHSRVVLFCWLAKPGRYTMALKKKSTTKNTYQEKNLRATLPALLSNTRAARTVSHHHPTTAGHSKYQVGPTVDTKTYTILYFYQQYLVLFTMVPRDRVMSTAHAIGQFSAKKPVRWEEGTRRERRVHANISTISVCPKPLPCSLSAPPRQGVLFDKTSCDQVRCPYSDDCVPVMGINLSNSKKFVLKPFF